jgi:hypothetical protein
MPAFPAIEQLPTHGVTATERGTISPRATLALPDSVVEPANPHHASATLPSKARRRAAMRFIAHGHTRHSSEPSQVPHPCTPSPSHLALLVSAITAILHLCVIAMWTLNRAGAGPHRRASRVSVRERQRQPCRTHDTSAKICRALGARAVAQTVARPAAHSLRQP